jgi:hypothetical protein
MIPPHTPPVKKFSIEWLRASEPGPEGEAKQARRVGCWGSERRLGDRALSADERASVPSQRFVD